MPRCFVALAMLAAMAAACDRQSLPVGATMDASIEAGATAGHPGAPDLRDARAADPDVPVVVPPPDPLPDAGPAPDAPYPPPPPEDPRVSRAREARRQELDAFKGRLVDCFGPLPPSISIEDDAELLVREFAGSLRLGLAIVNEAAVAACLSNLASASCDQIADLFNHPDILDGPMSCGEPLLGTVPEGKPCTASVDCQLWPQSTCEPALTCGDVCKRAPRANPPPPTGAPCMSRGVGECAPDVLCRSNRKDGPLLCLPRAKEGAYCDDSFDCAPGLACIPTTATGFEGICRPLREGLPCKQPWECSEFLVCVGLGQGMGTCQKGKSVGQPCTYQQVHVDDQTYTFSDCSYQLSCVDVDGKGVRCTADSGPGQPCGAVVAPPDEMQYCDGDSECDDGKNPRGVCRAYVGKGGACTDSGQCQPPFECGTAGPGTPSTCREFPPMPQEQPLGQRCGPGYGFCEPRGFCLYPEVNPNPDLPNTGVCVPLLHEGQPCLPGRDTCEPLTDCVAGTCRRC